MGLAALDVKRAEVGVGVVLMALAGVLARESVVLGAGWGPTGPQPGFFPFLCSLVMGVGSAVTIVRALRGGPNRPLYESSEEALGVLKVGIPIALAVASLQYLGFYVMTALYMGLFAAWYGRYRWYIVLPVSVLLPAVIYLVFEHGFRISLPKSILYGTLTPF